MYIIKKKGSTLFIFINLLVFAINIVLFLNAKKVVTYLNHGEENSKKTRIFKMFNILLLITHGADILFKEYGSDIINVGYTIIVIYISFIFYEVLSYYNRRKVGTKEEKIIDVYIPLEKKELELEKVNKLSFFIKELIVKTEKEIENLSNIDDLKISIKNINDLILEKDLTSKELSKEIDKLNKERSKLNLEELEFDDSKILKTKKVKKDIVKYEDNFNTRINNIFILVFISSITIITFLKLWNMESALEQKGLIGIILAALLFTSAHWLPNIFKGLTLMNSNRISRYDIVRMKGKFYIINEIGLQYTELRDIKSNKSVLLENSIFSENKIANLSRKVSLDGYRDTIQFNVGYPSMKIDSEEEYDKNMEKWKSIFTEIYNKLPELKDIKVTNKYEIFMVDAGDYAIKWEFSFYYEDFSKLKSTGAIRKVLSSRYRLIELIQKKAHLRGISLSTPVLEQKVIEDN